MKEQFEGVGVALVTPFNDDLSVDYQGLERLLDYVLNGGVNYLVVNGTTAEASTLTPTEKADILKFIGNHVDGRVPVVYGIGANNTEFVLDTIKETDFDSVDAVLTVSPYYNKPTQEGMYQHYKAVADHSPRPIILYNVPGRTGVNLEASTTLRLADHKNIIGIKEASGNLEQCMRIAKDKPADFLLISGDDLLTMPLIACGATGVISVLANAFPETFTSVIKNAMNNDFEASRSLLYSDFLEVNELMYKESNPVGVKLALRKMGICGDEVRLPLVKASSVLEAEMDIALKKLEV